MATSEQMSVGHINVGLFVYSIETKNANNIKLEQFLHKDPK